MTCLIADTFTNSLAKPTGEEQKAVKTTGFNLQMDRAAVDRLRLHNPQHLEEQSRRCNRSGGSRMN
jgi:hypothetical protein